MIVGIAVAHVGGIVAKLLYFPRSPMIKGGARAVPPGANRNCLMLSMQPQWVQVLGRSGKYCSNNWAFRSALVLLSGESTPKH